MTSLAMAPRWPHIGTSREGQKEEEDVQTLA